MISANRKRLDAHHLGIWEFDSNGFTHPITYLQAHQIQLPENLATARESRRIDFLAGRFCAKMAMSALSLPYPDAGIPIDKTRAPVWPDSVQGAITHKNGFAAALVSHHPALLGVGLDCEAWLSYSKERFRQHITHDDEYHRLKAALRWDREATLTFIFSAKESIYKALFPKVRRYFGFHTVTLGFEICDHRPTFFAKLNQDLGPFIAGQCLPIVFRAEHQRILTATLVTQFGAEALQSPKADLGFTALLQQILTKEDDLSCTLANTNLALGSSPTSFESNHLALNA